MLRAVTALLVLLVPSVALMIGNQGYSPEIGRLANPHNDVALLERTLKGLGFEVAVERDAGLAALTRAVNAYARRIQAAGPNAVIEAVMVDSAATVKLITTAIGALQDLMDRRGMPKAVETTLQAFFKSAHDYYERGAALSPVDVFSVSHDGAMRRVFTGEEAALQPQAVEQSIAQIDRTAPRTPDLSLLTFFLSSDSCMLWQSHSLQLKCVDLGPMRQSEREAVLVEALPARALVVLEFAVPATPVLRSVPTRGADWLHEAKFDGWRIQLHKDGSLVRLYQIQTLKRTPQWRSSRQRNESVLQLALHQVTSRRD